VISDSIDHLGIHDNRIKGDQVGNEETNLVSFIKDIKHSLLLERNLSQAKLDCQRIFVWFLEEPMTKRVENLNRRADNFEKPLLWPTTFRYSCPSVFIRG
jgi:hypothetical protein